MSLPLTRKSADHSTLEQFSFSFFCDRCGKEFLSEIVPFNKGNFTAIEHEEARQLLWVQEHKTAFEQANVDARLKFTLCRGCGRRICDECLSLDSRQTTDLCKDCV
jgi:hypothetical protein